MTQIFSSLRFRLIILVLMAVFPAFGVILHSAAKHRTLTAEQVQGNALRVARVIAAEQERYFQSAHQHLITLAGLPQVREKNNAACNKILAALLEPLYADLGVVDLKGNTVCSALRAGSSLPSNSASLFKRVVETTDFSIGDFRINPSTGRTTVDLGYPVLDSSGFLRAIVFVALDLSWITRITAETYLYPGASFTLVDSKGTVLIRYPESDGWIGKAISPGSPIAEGTTEVVGADGMPRLFAFSEAKNRMGGQTMYTGIDIPAALAFAEADRILVRDLITLGILSVLALTAAWLGADLFVIRRIRELVTATKEIAAGNLASRTRLPYGKSELGQLARTFDDLAEALENREAEAQASAEHIQKQLVELERSNRIKDEFLGVMSHELRTPLNVIMNYAEALSSGMFGDMAPDHKRGTEKIKSQAGHLLTLINGILEITKIETGTVTLLKEPIDLEDFVTEIRSDYMISVEKEVTLNWEVSPDLPMIVSDRMKLKQILTNLINNAIKFTDAGSVTISVQSLDQRQTVEFAVADTGPGISDELIPVIFDKFRQLDSTTTRSYSGAGLGLYIVKTFTELLDGKVNVRSTLGEGSTFTIRLPIGNVNEATARETANFDARQDGLN
ncbi:MAG TPA: sensor histidine kinase [Candidatus Binatia bacterium]|nr:sensor histidine kinase [Candidatus Binatia bacterium]